MAAAIRPRRIGFCATPCFISPEKAVLPIAGASVGLPKPHNKKENHDPRPKGECPANLSACSTRETCPERSRRCVQRAQPSHPTRGFREHYSPITFQSESRSFQQS